MVRRSNNMDMDKAAFYTVLLVVFVDQVGLHFIAPALVPLAIALDAGPNTVSLLFTVRGVAALLCGFWLPRFADTRGRRPAIIISCLGSAIGYLLQGLVFKPSSSASGLNLMLIGKAVEGLFSMTMPVALAYVTDITKHDMAKLRTRTTTIGAVNQLVPILVAPIGGAIATFGLEIPSLVACGIAVFGLLISVMYMHEAKYVLAWMHKKDDGDAQGPVAVVTAPAAAPTEPGGGEKKEGAAAAATAAALLPEPDAAKAPSVWCDPNLLGLGVGLLCLAVTLIAQQMLLPYLLARPSFGLQRATVAATQEQIAKGSGLVGIPNGLLNVVAMALVYPKLLNKGWSEARICLFGGVVAGVPMLFFPWCSALWHLVLLNSVMGVGIGTFFGCFMNAPSPYLAKVHPAKISQGRAVYFQFLTVGLIIAPVMLARIFEAKGLKAGFGVAGGFMILGAVVCGVVVRRMKIATEPKKRGEAGGVEGGGSEHGGENLTPFERQEMERTGARPVDAFLDELFDGLKAKLRARNYRLTHRSIQVLVAAALDQALPPLTEWRKVESNQGAGTGAEGAAAAATACQKGALSGEGLLHLQEIARLLDGVGRPDEVAAMEARHGLGAGELGFGDAALSLFGTGLTAAALLDMPDAAARRPRSSSNVSSRSNASAADEATHALAAAPSQLGATTV